MKHWRRHTIIGCLCVVVLWVGSASWLWAGVEWRRPLRPGKQETIYVRTNHVTVLEIYTEVEKLFAGDLDSFMVQVVENDRRFVWIKPLYEGAATNLVLTAGGERLVASLVEVSGDAELAAKTLDYWKVEAPKRTQALVRPTTAEVQADQKRKAKEMAERMVPERTEDEIADRMTKAQASLEDFSVDAKRKALQWGADITVKKATLIGDSLYVVYEVEDAALEDDESVTLTLGTGTMAEVLKKRTEKKVTEDGQVIYRRSLAFDLGDSSVTNTYRLDSYAADGSKQLYTIELRQKG